MIKGLMNTLNISEEDAGSLIKNCTSDALIAMGRIKTVEGVSNFVVEAVSGVKKAVNNVTGSLKAASAKGSKESNAIELRAMAKIGNLSYTVLEAEALEELYVPKSGIAAYIKGEGDTGHVVVIKGVGEGKVRYIDSGDERELAVKEFKDMGFEGLLMVSRYAKSKNSDKLSNVSSSRKEVREFFAIEEGSDFARERKYSAGRKLADLILNGITEAEELGKAVMYVLSIWKNTGEMAERLGMSLEEVKGENGVEAITQGYYKQVGSVLEAGENGELSPGEVMTEVKLLSTIRDMLIGVSKGDSQLESLLDKESLGTGEISSILSKVTLSKAVNHNVMVKGMESARDSAAELKSAGKGEITAIDVNKLKTAVEEKKKMKDFVGRFFGSNAKMEEVLPSLGDRSFVSSRGTMMSPMMSRALAASA